MNEERAKKNLELYFDHGQAKESLERVQEYCGAHIGKITITPIRLNIRQMLDLSLHVTPYLERTPAAAIRAAELSEDIKAGKPIPPVFVDPTLTHVIDGESSFAAHFLVGNKELDALVATTGHHLKAKMEMRMEDDVAKLAQTSFAQEVVDADMMQRQSRMRM